MSGAIILWLVFLVAVGLSLVPQLGKRGAALLGGCAVGLAGLAALAGSADQSLQVVFSYPAFVANRVESKDFIIEETIAPAYAWTLAAAAFCGLLAGLAWRGLPHRRPLTWALAFAWLGAGLALVLEKLAAPPAAVAFRLDAALWLGSIAAAVALAQRGPSLVQLGLGVAIASTALRLPIALFGTLATWQGWGTSLDVHSIEFCAHPLAQTPLTLEPGSVQQLWYLVWAQQLVVYPALTFASAGGVGFLTLMARRGREAEARAA
jgi:hypothetical protein